MILNVVADVAGEVDMLEKYRHTDLYTKSLATRLVCLGLWSKKSDSSAW